MVATDLAAPVFGDTQLLPSNPHSSHQEGLFLFSRLTLQNAHILAEEEEGKYLKYLWNPAWEAPGRYLKSW